MSKSKEFVVTASGTTKALVDGKPRQVTVAGVSQYGVLRIGLSVVHPDDTAKVSIDIATNIAVGRTRKDKTVLEEVTATPEFFSRHMVKAIVDQQLDRVINFPDHFIKVSPLKGKLDKVLLNATDGYKQAMSIPAESLSKVYTFEPASSTTNK